MSTVNKELIELYWNLGKMIVQRQTLYAWGNSVVEMLTKDLRKTFPNMGGLSKTNLCYTRAFYLAYTDCEFLPPLVGEIGRTLNFCH